MTGPIQWQAIRTAQGSAGETAPDPERPGQYLYYGPDGVVYRNSYPGEVHPNDVANSQIGTRASVDKQYQTSQYTGKSTAPTVGTTNAKVGAGTNPYQPTYLGNPTQGVATTDQAASAGGAALSKAASSNAQTSLDPSLISSLGAGATLQDLMKSFAPQTATANSNLNSALAAAGISGGGAIDAQQQLSGQLAAAQDPTLAAALQNSQANTLAAGEFGTTNALQQAMANAGYQQQAGQFNAGAINQQGQYNAGLQQQSGIENQQASNAMTDQNLANLMSNQSQNANFANNAQNEYAAALQNAYYQQQNQFNQINNAGLAGQQNVTSQGQGAANSLSQQYGNAYGTSTPSAGYGALASAVGSAFGGGSNSGQNSSGTATYGGQTLQQPSVGGNSSYSSDF